MKPGRRVWMILQVVLVCTLVAVTYAVLLKPEDEGRELQGITTPNGRQVPGAGEEGETAAAGPNATRRERRNLPHRAALAQIPKSGHAARGPHPPPGGAATPQAAQYADSAAVLLARLRE